jgi:hypothetical protein
MATIFRNKELEDYFIEVDCSDLSGVVPDDICRYYEVGQVILLSGFKVDFDKEFIASVNFPDTPKSLKKFPSHKFLELEARESRYFGLKSLLCSARHQPSLSGQVLQQVFQGNRQRFCYFKEQVRHVNNQILFLCQALFPMYERIHDSITWRFSETRNENMHVDIYTEDLPEHHLRLFVNMDTVPRLWNTSWTLEQMLQSHLDKLDPLFVQQATSGRICHDLNFQVFGRMRDAGRDGQPRHIAFFEPGEVWLVDSRKVSHQIVYGRRAISTDFAIVRQSMLDQDQHYYNVVDRFRPVQQTLEL